jgi:hypothetical protein
MRAFEFLVESEMKTIGREFNHLEDLVFSEPNGVTRAVQILKDMEQDSKDVSLKWDGNPTVYWGRDEDGTFRLVGKNNWGKEEGKSGSPEELEQFILSRGKKEEWRPKFAKDMAALWPIFEAATPKDYRGYVYADLLYYPGKPYEGKDGKITFTPNQTTYSVRATSNVGKKIGKSKIGVAAHSEYQEFGDTSATAIKDVNQFNTKDLVVFGQTYVTHQPAVDAENIGKIEGLAKDYQGKINQFFIPQKGLSDLQEIVYRYVNQTSREKQLDKLSSQSFLNWLGSSKVSAGKQSKIQQLAAANADTINAVFVLVKEIMKAKDEIIAELDQAEGDITATTGGTPGGEGYVKMKDKVKLVPRDRWTPFRSD